MRVAAVSKTQQRCSHQIFLTIQLPESPNECNCLIAVQLVDMYVRMPDGGILVFACRTRQYRHLTSKYPTWSEVDRGGGQTPDRALPPTNPVLDNVTYCDCSGADCALQTSEIWLQRIFVPLSLKLLKHSIERVGTESCFRRSDALRERERERENVVEISTIFNIHNYRRAIAMHNN